MKSSQISDLSLLAREVYFESKTQHSKSEKLSIHFNDRTRNSCPVAVDSKEIKHALMNLVVNAIKSTNEAGDVFIELQSQGWKCAFDVVDYGPGLSKESLIKLGRATSDDPEIEALGLGLSHKVVRDAHGALSFEALKGQGTRVRIELPLASN